MTSAQIYLDKEEDDKVNDLAHEWKISKQDVIKKLIRDFKPERRNN